MWGSAFYKITLDLKADLFNELLTSVDFEPVAKGRLGNHLVNASDKGVPIVRTTTKYNIPANNFSALHHRLVAQINESIRKENPADIKTLQFNNALIEVYDSSYSKMNFHSDQSLDLDDDSYIALFSCYEKPEELFPQYIRKLKVKDKLGDEESGILLTHNSVILFSTTTNTKFQHKIVLDPAQAKTSVSDNRWLGITFRMSKTYIRFDDNVPRFPNGKPLVLAGKDQEAEFFKLRGQENRELNFVYPELTYTINVADTLMPKNS